MKRLAFALSAAVLPVVCLAGLPAQMDHAAAPTAGHAGMKHEAGAPSTTLVITGLDGRSKTLTTDEVKAMPHVTVTVTNGHSHQQETYSGVPLKSLLDLVASSPTQDAKRRLPRLGVLVAGATDGFHVVLTLCDTDPACRNGQAIVADAMNGKPLGADGAFKLVLTEDKMPGRWARNLNSLTVKNLGDL